MKTARTALVVTVALLSGFSVLNAQSDETQRGPRAGAERKERPAAENRERAAENRERAAENRERAGERGEQRPGQQRPGQAERPALEALGLTEQQREQVREAMQANQSAMQALRADTSLTPEQRRAKAMELREAHQARMQAILTPEQFARLQEARQRQVEQRRGPAAEGRAAPEQRGERRGPPADGERQRGPARERPVED